MQVTVLGPIALSQTGERVEVGARLQRLLAALVVADGDVVSIDRLTEVVWDGDTPRRPDSTLRSYVTRLRRALDADGDVIQRRGPGYSIELQAGQLDASTFTDELDRARTHLRTGDASAATELLERALGRWHGPALAGLAEEEWARPTAVRLEERRLEAAEALIEAHVALGRIESAIASARSLAEDEPLRERPRELLMRSLYHAGRQADALREYAGYRRHLADETGLDPSTDLADLEGRIARGDLENHTTTRALGSYELAERIGEGAFAVVHRGRQPRLERDVAIKVIRAELADSSEFIRRFEIEAQTIARIEHPHVVPLFDFWREPGAAYLVMRLLQGGSLQSALRTGGPLSRDRVVDVVEQIGGGLQAAHNAGVVHRDVRPANLLLDQNGVAYLADFGIAVPAAQATDVGITAPEYASPEVLRGDPAGVTADVMSLGVTVYELLTGRLPFADSNDRAELVRRQMSEPLPSVCATRTDLPPEIDQVLARATSKVAADRYQTIAALVVDVDQALSPSATGRTHRTPRPSSAAPTENPFVGLHAFTELDSGRFHGRNALVAELSEALSDRNFVVAVGPSGSGKSSVVRAGLLPAVRRGAIHGSDDWFVTTMLPGADPVAALESALLRVAVNPPASLHQQLAEPGGLLRAIQRVLPDERARILLVVDQFEELFTQVSDPVDRDRFLTELAEAINSPRSPLRVVATLRADHYDAPLRHRGMARLVTDGTVTVQPMTPSELERAIVAPAESVGVDVEPALVAELVAGIDERPAALPLLQFSLTEVFERRVADVMLLETHREIGGLAGAVAERAERIAGDDNNDVDIVRRILGRLVTISDHGNHTRRRARLAEFGVDERTAWLIDAFVTARLLTTGRDDTTREPTIEVAHESLLRDWPRLQRWIADERDDLQTLHRVATAAREWDHGGRQHGELARDARLAGASHLATRRPDWLTEREHSWVAASLVAAQQLEDEAQARAERDRRQNRRLRGLLAAAACLLVVSVGAATIAFTLRNRAETARLDAEEARAGAEADREDAEDARADADTARVDEENARVDAETAQTDAEAARADAEIDRLVALSTAEIGTAPDRAILLALEAQRRRDDVGTQTAVHRAISSEPRLESIHPDPFGTASVTALSSDGSTGVTVTLTDGRARWFDASTGDLGDTTFEASEEVAGVAISGDGSATALSLREGGVLLVDRSGNETTRLAGEYVAFTPALDGDGDLLAVSRNQTNEIVIVEIATGATRSTVYLDDDLPAANHLRLSDSGGMLIVGANPPGGAPANSATMLFDTDSGDRLQRWDHGSGPVTAVDISAGTVASGLDDGTVEIRTLDGESSVAISAHSGRVEAVLVTDDDRIVSAGGNEVKLWSTDGRPIASPMAVTATIAALAADADDRVTIARLSDGHIVADFAGGALFEAAYPDGAGGQVTAYSPYYDAPQPQDPTGRSATIVELATGEVVREIDMGDVFTAPMGPPFHSSDGEWIMTFEQVPNGRVRMIEILGDRRFDFRSGDVYRALFDEEPDGSVFFGIRPAAGGRLFATARGGSNDSPRAAWFDPTTMEVLAGPLELPFGGSVLVLADGKVVVGGNVRAIVSGAPLSVLPKDLDGPAVVVSGTEGMAALHQDPTTGRVLAGGPGGRAGILDPLDATFTPIAGASGTIRGGAFSPDGSRIALSSFEEGLQLFDANSLEPLGVPVDIGLIDGASAPGVRWSDNGESVWVTPAFGPIRIAASPESWREIACRITQRDLSQNEWRTFVSDSGEPVGVCDR